MVKVKIRKNENGDFYKAEMSGHALFNPGNDIVCSAVSALGYTLVGSLMNVQEIDLKYMVEDGLYCEVSYDSESINTAKKQTVNTIFDTVLIGLLQVEQGYPENVMVEVVE